jgi:heat shock protein 4
MSVSGIDFGNLNLLIAQTAKGGVDVILNESSNRQTATTVSIQGKQRYIGDSGAAMARTNLSNTIMGMKLLVGRKFDDADVQTELAKWPFRAVKMAHGGVGIEVLYNDETVVVSAEHFMAMMLVKAKDISLHANNGLNLADSVLSVPHWFTQAQRRGVLNACEIAQLNCLKVTNDSNAIALSYGIFKSAKKLFSETEPTHVMFIDLGYTSYCVTIVDFIQENMKVRSTVCEPLGGRDFDDIIIEFLAETFQKKTGINVRSNKKAILKLQAAAEKAKKTLSPAGVSEASISVECLAEDIDLNALLTRDEFETRAAPLVARLRAPIERALREAGLTNKDLAEIEIVGGSTRVNIIKKTLGSILELDPSALNYGLKTTMNADEAVARGAALQCAILSVRLKVKAFNIIDTMAYGVVAHFETAQTQDESVDGSIGNEVTAADGSQMEEVSSGANRVTTAQSSVPLYSRGDEIPHKPRRITFRHKTADFVVTLAYDDEAVTLLPPGESRHIGRYIVRIPADKAHLAADVRVTFALDRSGLVVLSSAQLMEELPAEPEPAEGKAEEGKESSTDGSKRRFKKVELKVDVEEPGLSRQQIKEALELEASMAFEDRLIQETADKRNELEAYIYSMRDKLDGQLKPFAGADEKQRLMNLLSAAEDWLYGDGFESTKSEYGRRIEELRTIGDKIENRSYQQEHRPAAIDSLRKQLDMCKSFAANYNESHSHITDEERDRVRKEVSAADGWLADQMAKQGALPSSADPILTVDSISAKRTAIFNATNPIMIKPKPKPAAAEAKPEPPSPTPPADKDEKPQSKEGSKEGDTNTAMDEESPSAAGGDEAK